MYAIRVSGRTLRYLRYLARQTHQTVLFATRWQNWRQVGLPSFYERRALLHRAGQRIHVLAMRGEEEAPQHPQHRERRLLAITRLLNNCLGLSVLINLSREYKR